ncbi:TetR/AcrR family transcriptional regulator [Streptomyces bobili]|uniref:TetR/AcrR family transcriptional regulator n=1 Tax=Streptomyces bobili TaxID=67280 RepID=UPI0036547BB0
MGVEEPSESGARRRRSTDPRRKRDPERTRRLLLAAAAEEFSQRGYEGARVMRIAEAAGVGHQLITYHFGGKKGLYEALDEDLVRRSSEMFNAPEPLAEVMKECARWAFEDETWARLMVREAMEGGFPIRDQRVAGLIEMVERARLRQKSGELDEDLDVGALSVALLAACIAPVILPAFARAFVGLDPSSADFQNLYVEQLGKLILALGRSGAGPGTPPA